MLLLLRAPLLEAVAGREFPSMVKTDDACDLALLFPLITRKFRMRMGRGQLVVTVRVSSMKCVLVHAGMCMHAVVRTRRSQRNLP